MIEFVKTRSGFEGFKSVYRGVEYLAHPLGGQWFVSTRRLSLGRFNTGGGRYYATLEDVAANVKAFAGLDKLAYCGGSA